MAHKFFIFVSNRLRTRRYLSLGDGEFEVLAISEGLLSVEKEPPENDSQADPWESVLKNAIAERILTFEGWKESRVRIAAHLRTSFGNLPDSTWRRDRRFPDRETGLHQKLGHEIDLEVWGFHHDPELSEICTVARRIRDVWKSEDEKPKADFLDSLDEAFKRSHAAFINTSSKKDEQENWELFSLLKHDVVGLFDPLRIRLENARDIRESNPTRAAEITSSVQAALQTKLNTAREMLKRSEGDVRGAAASQCFRQAQAELAKAPELSELPSWLNRISKYLDNLRNAASQ